MNKLTGIICAIIMVSMNMVSCKKDQQTSETTTPNDKLKRYTEERITPHTHPSDTFNISYDNTQRITGITGKNSHNTYQYYNGYFIFTDYSGSVVTKSEIYYLNGNQQVDSSRVVSNTNNYVATKYSYNAAGKLSEERDYYHYANGNILLHRIYSYLYNANGDPSYDIQTDITGATQYTFSYTYAGINGTSPFASTYFPSRSSQLPVTITFNEPSGFTDHSNFTYTFDNQHRLTSKTSINPSDTTSFVSKYFY